MLGGSGAKILQYNCETRDSFCFVLFYADGPHPNVRAVRCLKDSQRNLSGVPRGLPLVDGDHDIYARCS